jgi:hypothetical protein
MNLMATGAAAAVVAGGLLVFVAHRLRFKPDKAVQRACSDDPDVRAAALEELVGQGLGVHAEFLYDAAEHEHDAEVRSRLATAVADRDGEPAVGVAAASLRVWAAHELSGQTGPAPRLETGPDPVDSWDGLLGGEQYAHATDAGDFWGDGTTGEPAGMDSAEMAAPLLEAPAAVEVASETAPGAHLAAAPPVAPAPVGPAPDDTWLGTPVGVVPAVAAGRVSAQVLQRAEALRGRLAEAGTDQVVVESDGFNIVIDAVNGVSVVEHQVGGQAAATPEPALDEPVVVRRRRRRR